MDDSKDKIEQISEENLNTSKEYVDGEQEFFLPIANVTKIMRRGLPETAKISKDAKECSQECVSEFIAFVTSEASDRCVQEKRKTINGEDIIYALSSLGFDNYVEILKFYLQKYRDSTIGDRKKSMDEVDPMDGLNFPKNDWEDQTKM
eukprot:gene4183-7493_t